MDRVCRVAYGMRPDRVSIGGRGTLRDWKGHDLSFFGLTRRVRLERTGSELYCTVVAAARDPFLYTDLGVPDTLDGRFDMVSLYGFLLIQRLKREPMPGPALAQAVFDAMFTDMDVNLREMGVGDLSVGHKVRVMWEAFHGRAASYAAAIVSGGVSGGVADVGPALREALIRNIWRGEAPPGDRAARLERLTLAQDAALRDQNMVALREGRVLFRRASDASA